MGGNWEHNLRSVRAIFNSRPQTHGHSLNEGYLPTLINETEAVINSEPLTVETINDEKIQKLIS